MNTKPTAEETTLGDALEEHFTEDIVRPTPWWAFALFFVGFFMVGGLAGFGTAEYLARKSTISTVGETTWYTSAVPAAKPDEKEKERKIVTKLSEFYCAANHRYFGNMLAKYKAIQIVESDSAWAMYSPFQVDYAASAEISVNRNIAIGNLRYAKLAILHEMAHAYVDLLNNINEGDAHGDKFQKEMRRLASMGAFEGLW